MSGIIKRIHKGVEQQLCYDESHPMIFHDEATALSWLRTSKYTKKMTSDEDIKEHFIFEEINVDEKRI